MYKQALHADDRLKERTSLPPEALTRLRQHLQKTHLPRGTHHVRLGPHGYAVLKDTGKRHVVATVLSRHMTAPGKDVTTRLEFGLSKEAAAKWRALVRAGQLSPKSLNELKAMGLHGTEASLAKETAGIIRGNEALAKKHGIDLVLGEKTPWYTANTQARFPLFFNQNKPISLNYTVVGPSGGASPKERFRNAVVVRHEVDEARSMRRALQQANRMSERSAKKSGGKPDYMGAVSRGVKVRMKRRSHLFPGITSAHMSPFVIMEEAGHYNMGGGAGLKKLRYIFRPQDVRQVGEWAGKQRPYTRLPQGRRKVMRNFEREVREEIRTGKPKNRSRWFENIPLIGLGSGLVGLGVAADRRRWDKKR
jgi:hypothetical protein